MRIGKKAKLAFVGIVASGAILATSGSAFASSYDGGDVWNYGCHGFIEKISSNWAQAEVSGGCYISIDQTNKNTGGWAKPGGWYYYGSGQAYFGDGVHGVTACITPYSDTSFSYETCGPLVWS